MYDDGDRVDILVPDLEELLLEERSCGGEVYEQANHEGKTLGAVPERIVSHFTQLE